MGFLDFLKGKKPDEEEEKVEAPQEQPPAQTGMPTLETKQSAEPSEPEAPKPSAEPAAPETPKKGCC